MDPNVTLDRIRELLAATHCLTPDPTDLLDLAAAVRDLDEWLSRGGFLPAAWQTVPR